MYRYSPRCRADSTKSAPLFLLRGVHALHAQSPDRGFFQSWLGHFGDDPVYLAGTSSLFLITYHFVLIPMLNSIEAPLLCPDPRQVGRGLGQDKNNSACPLKILEMISRVNRLFWERIRFRKAGSSVKKTPQKLLHPLLSRTLGRK